MLYFLTPTLFLFSSNTNSILAMGTLQQLSIDSFSYSWLANSIPSFDTLDDGLSFSFDDVQDGGSFIDMDPNLVSKYWTGDRRDFDFNLPISQSSYLVHADQIFSNGLLLPLHLITPPERDTDFKSLDSALSRSFSLDSSKMLLSRSVYPLPSVPIPLNSSPLLHSVQSTPISWSSCSIKRGISRSTKIKLPFLWSCGKSMKKNLLKYLCFLMSLYKKVKRLRLVERQANSTVVSVRSCTGLLGTSPRTSNAFSSIQWCRGSSKFDMVAENSIYDAVQHCKKSIGTG